MMLDILTSFAPHPIARSCSEIYSLVPLDVLHVVAIYHFGQWGGSIPLPCRFSYCLACHAYALSYNSVHSLCLFSVWNLLLVCCSAPLSCEHEPCHLLLCYPNLALLSFGGLRFPSFLLMSSGISSILPSFASLRLVVLTSVLSSLFIGRHWLLLRALSLMCPVCGRDTPCPCFSRSYFADFAFAFPTAKVRQAVLLKIPWYYLLHKKEQQPSTLYAKVGIPLFFLEIICCALPLLSSGCSVKIKV